MNGYLEIHTKKGTMVWGDFGSLTKAAIKKVLGRTHISIQMLQTIIVEVEALLSDRPLIYVSHDTQDPEPLTPSH